MDKKPRHSTVTDEETRLEREAARRRAAESRKRRRRKVSPLDLLCLLATMAVSVPMMLGIQKRYTEFDRFHSQVVEKEAQKKALDRQYEAAQSRLAVIDSNKGRAQMLVERGYLHDNERILLFPTDSRPSADDGAAAPDAEPSTDAVSTPDPSTTATTPVEAPRAATARVSFWDKLRGFAEDEAPR